MCRKSMLDGHVGFVPGSWLCYGTGNLLLYYSLSFIYFFNAGRLFVSFFHTLFLLFFIYPFCQEHRSGQKLINSSVVIFFQSLTKSPRPLAISAPHISRSRDCGDLRGFRDSSNDFTQSFTHRKIHEQILHLSGREPGLTKSGFDRPNSSFSDPLEVISYPDPTV